MTKPLKPVSATLAAGTSNTETEKSLRRYLGLGYVSLAVMIGFAGVWSVESDLNGAVIAPATITVESYSKKIQHKDGGIVRDILVKDGDHVKAGQILVVLDNADAKAELSIVTGLLNEGLAKQARLSAERDGKTETVFAPELLQQKSDPKILAIMNGEEKLLRTHEENLAGKKAQMQQQAGQLSKQIGGIDAQTDSKDQQIVFIKQELKDLKSLAKSGLVPNNRLTALEREEARLDGERGELVAARASSEAKIAEVKLQEIQIQDEYLNQTLTELRDVDSKVAEYSQRKQAAASRIERLEVKAPSNGTIYQSSLHTLGGIVAAGEPMMLLVPDGDDLVLQAQVQPKDIGSVHTGQKANIRFPALHSRLTPEVAGEVIQVSADVSRADATSPPFYAVRLSLPANEVVKLGANKLKPGMPAEAFIQTEAQSPLGYLLKPLTDQFAHALRES